MAGAIRCSLLQKFWLWLMVKQVIVYSLLRKCVEKATSFFFLISLGEKRKKKGGFSK